jgi:hypothetical protein
MNAQRQIVGRFVFEEAAKQNGSRSRAATARPAGFDAGLAAFFAAIAAVTVLLWFMGL